MPYDQLSRSRGAMADADPARDLILMIRSTGMIASRTWHAQRIFLVLSAAAHYADDLRTEGFTVLEVDADSVADGISRFRAENPATTVVATQPRSRALQSALLAAGVELAPDDSFLTARETWATWTQDALPVMETFYRNQRTTLDLLMDGGKPVGGKWNLDADNRLPPPKGLHPWPEPIRHGMDAIDERVWRELADSGARMVGTPPDGTWATTRAGALRQLQHFLDTGLADFGPYEDAMPDGTWAVNHSVLSPYLNLGLLDPAEVVSAAIARSEAGDIPLSSIEGFVRQVIGWREFINAVYWATDDDYRDLNALEADLPLPPAYDDPSLTQMECLKSTVTDVHARGWVHHIPRLMILGNLALIAGVRPQELLAWMRRMFVDAADWVMVPNVIGMALYADGGKMTTKPYAGGGAYLRRMSKHCGPCPFDPAKRTGEDACPMTTLYWDFIGRHEDRWRGNHRMARSVAGLKRLADRDEIPIRAREVRERLARGEL